MLLIALGICWAAVMGLCRAGADADRGLEKSLQQEWQAEQSMSLPSAALPSNPSEAMIESAG